jgi:HEAT repeat protein
MIDPVSAWLGEWATVAIAGKVLQGVGAKLNPDEVQRALNEATRTASDEHKLFYRCAPDGRKGVARFLEDFFQGKGLVELQKPLNYQGEPDVDFLVKAFEQVASSHSEMKSIQDECLRPWMERFVAVYFSRTNCFLAFQVAKDDYLQQLVRQFDDVKFAGIATLGDERSKKAIGLEQIFVMLRVREESRGGWETVERLELPDGAWVEGRSPLRQERQSVPILAERLVEQWQPFVGDSKRSVVLGAPGSGKTTLMSYFAVRLTVGEEERLPILIRIRDWALKPDLSLLEYLRYFAEKRLQTKPLPVGFFEHWLEGGRALILLDGLDEVADEAKRVVLSEQIECFLGQYERNSAVITSRPAGYRRDFFGTAAFPHYELLPFDKGQRQEFVDRWYESRETDPVEREQRKQSLRKAFEGSERIKLLASNPLLLTIMVLIHRYQAVLPKERHRLYDKAVETLLLSWDGNKELSHQTRLEYLKLDDLRRLMEQVAYWIHTQGSLGEGEGGTLIDRDELLEQLSRDIKALKSIPLYQAKEEAERFLSFVRERTGLMNEQGEDCYAFVHKTFQEYLCTQEIMYRADDEDDFGIVLSHVRSHLHNQHWREVLLLLIGQQKPRKAAKVIQAIVDQNSEYEQWLHRDLLFAATCLTQNIKGLVGVEPEVWRPILDGLAELETTARDRVGYRVGEATRNILLDFGATEFEALVLQSLDQYKEQIFSSQFRSFRAALGDRSSVVSDLLDLLRNPASDVRYSAVKELGDLDDSSDRTITALLNLVAEDSSSFVRRISAETLGNLGKKEDRITSVLLALLSDSDIDVCHGAEEALCRLKDNTDRTITSLLNFLSSDNSGVRLRAVSILGNCGDSSNRIVTTLLESLDDSDWFLRFYIVSVLGNLGNTSDENINGLVCSHLRGLLKDPSPFVSLSAAVSLEKLHYLNDQIIKHIISALSDPDPNLCSMAIQAIRKSRIKGNHVIPALLELLSTTFPSLCFSAAKALISLGDNSDCTINALIELLSHYDNSIRFAPDLILTTSQVLSGLGNRNVPFVAKLLDLLSDFSLDFNIRFRVASILGILGNTSELAITTLINGLSDSHLQVSPVLGLGELGKQSPEVLLKIIQWLEAHQDTDDMGVAIDVLWAIVVE